jgi:hypothetical protein
MLVHDWHPLATIQPGMSPPWCRLGPQGTSTDRGVGAVSTPDESARLAAEAQTAAREAAARMVVHAEAWSSAAAAARAVRALELAVHAEVLGHIRRAREAGESWAAVGEMLGLGPIAANRPGPLAELAYDYSAGLPTVDPFPAPAVFRWDCPGCGGRIADHGPVKGPALDQDGHRGACPRLAADVADWDQEILR